jgi:FixJ family two-component response regulator
MAEPTENPMVYIIDDEPSVQRALVRLMRAAGFGGTAFSSVDEFMSTKIDTHNACVVADVHMPGTSALELLELLKRSGVSLPVIYMTARDTNATRERIHRAGAAGYFRKPVDDQALIDAIQWAITDEPDLRN